MSISRRQFLGTTSVAASLLALGRIGGFGDPPPMQLLVLERSMQRDLRGMLCRDLRQAMRNSGVPGAVALVEKNGKEVFCKAFGHAALIPERRAMRPGCLFDLASLTKVVATAPSILLLRDRGALHLDDPLARHLPLWDDPAKQTITIRHCMTHTTGLAAFRAFYKELSGKEAYFEALRREPLQFEPGARRVYSDLGFMLLGFVVEAVSGEPLEVFSRREVFEPLGMSQTRFRPLEREGAAERDFAATELCPWRGRVMAGEVHDENAYAMGGVSGHAGLFSTARDLARFARMLIAKGEFFEALADSAGQAPANATIPVQAGEMPSSETLCMRLPSRRGARQLLSPESVCLLNTPQIPGIDPEAGLAWRMCLEGESAIGFLASPRSFGHTGFTGTSLWIDPDNRIAAVLLTNSAHPARGGASAKEARLSFHRATVRIFSPAPAQRTKSGLDVLEAEGFERLAGKRVAIAANHTAINGRGESIFSLLRKQTNLELAMIFGPEHGFAGRAGAGEKVGDDEWEGVPVLSLYGQRRKPPPESAEKFDVMLFDIQDVGARFYTYIWTLFQIQQFCAESGKPLIVLDRPNPIGGRLIEGPVLDAANASFLGLKPLPIRHGLTVGELALLYNRAGWLGPGLTAELDVVAMDGWRREMAFIETGLPWAAPSPNMRTWDTALVYPGTCLFEGTQWSEGRGTNNPFELVGGPGVDSRRLAMELNALGLEGCRFLPAEFTPAAPPEDAIRPKLEDQRCGGVFLRVDDRESFRPVRAGLAMLIALRGLYPGRHQWRASSFDRLAGTDSIRTHIDAGTPLATIEATWSEGLAQFDALRRAVAIYE